MTVSAFFGYVNAVDFEAGSNCRGFLLRSIVNEINILAPAAKTAAAAATRWSVEASMRYGLFLFSLNRSLRPQGPSLKVFTVNSRLNLKSEAFVACVQ